VNLATRWTLALVAVCLVEAALVGVAVQLSTRRAFDRLVRDQAMSGFADDVTRYYRAVGSLDGIGAWFRPPDAPPPEGPPPPEAPPPPPPRGRYGQGRPDQGRPYGSGGAYGEEPPPVRADAPPPVREGGRGRGRHYRFALADRGGVIVVPGADFRPGDVLAADDARERWPLVIDGDTVGTVLRTSDSYPLGEDEQRYLGATRAALGWAVGGALAVALVLGALLARAVTRPVRALTEAAGAVARGELGRTVEVRSRDEVGALGDAFNAMSARLAEAHALRRRMTADVAHDLRSPLAVLTGYLEALRDGALEATPERFDAMHAEATHLGRLIEDLRTLALADAGELPLHRAPVAPGKLLARVAAAFGPEAQAAGITLTVEAPDALPAVHVDAERMVQVLGNLVGNALRHTPAGGRVTLAARSHGDRVALTVADTGEGIPPDVLPHVFERTVRADAARSTDGSGLGLAIARSLVEAHGGTISVASQPGQGATFTVVLGRTPAAPDR